MECCGRCLCAQPSSEPSRFPCVVAEFVEGIMEETVKNRSNFQVVSSEFKRFNKKIYRDSLAFPYGGVDFLYPRVESDAVLWD